MTPTSNRAQHQHQTQYINPNTLIIRECNRPAKPKLQGAYRQIGANRSIKTCCHRARTSHPRTGTQQHRNPEWISSPIESSMRSYVPQHHEAHRSAVKDREKRSTAWDNREACQTGSTESGSDAWSTPQHPDPFHEQNRTEQSRPIAYQWCNPKLGNVSKQKFNGNIWPARTRCASNC